MHRFRWFQKIMSGILLFACLSACTAGWDADELSKMEAAARKRVSESSGMAGEWKLVECKENPAGVFFFYQNDDAYAGIHFQKQENGRLREGLCSVPTEKTTKEGISEGSLYEKSMFTYVLTGQKPENAKELSLVFRDKHGAEIKRDRTPLSAASPAFYYGYQTESPQALYAEYSFDG